MDDFRRLNDSSDSTAEPFGSPLCRERRPAWREPSAPAAQAWHRVAGVLLALGIGSLARIVRSTGATVAVNAIRYAKRRHTGRLGDAADLVAITVGSVFGGVVVLLWILWPGHVQLPAYIAFGPVVTVLLVGVFLLKARQRSPGHA